MSQSIISEKYLIDIANSIRNKTNTDESIAVSDMGTAISRISDGVDISDTTATDNDVVYGSVFHKANKEATTGKLLSTKHLDGQNCKHIYANEKVNFDSLTAMTTLKVTKNGTVYESDSKLVIHMPSNDNKRNNSFIFDFNASNGAFQFRYDYDIGDTALNAKVYTINAYNAIFSNTGIDILGYYVTGAHELLLIYSWLSSNTAKKIQRPGVYIRLLSPYGASSALTFLSTVTLPYGATAGSYYKNINFFPIEKTKEGLGDYMIVFNSFQITTANVVNVKRVHHKNFSLWANNTSALFCVIGVSYEASVQAKITDGSDVFYLPSNARMYTRVSRTSAGVNTKNIFLTTRHMKTALIGPVLGMRSNTADLGFGVQLPAGSGTFVCGVIGELEDGNLVLYGATCTNSDNIQYMSKIFIANLKYNRGENLSILNKLQEIDLGQGEIVNSENYIMLKCNVLYNKETGLTRQLVLNSNLTGYELYTIGTFTVKNESTVITDEGSLDGSTEQIVTDAYIPLPQGQFSNLFEGIGEAQINI